MRWTAEAEAALKKVPFFVRIKVKSRVEKETAAGGKTVVDIEAVKTTQKRYLSGMAAEVKGYRVLLGGKLGRHPQLARELPGIFSQQEVLDIVDGCLALYKKKSRSGKRFAELLTDADIETLAKQGR